MDQNLESTVLGCVNHGGDPDIVGAVGGGLAGALYGYDQIPSSWLRVIARKSDIEELIERFLGVI